MDSVEAHLRLAVKGNVGHLLARVEEGVLRGLGEDVLGGTDQHGSHERGEAHSRQQGGDGRAEEHQSKEQHTCDVYQHKDQPRHHKRFHFLGVRLIPDHGYNNCTRTSNEDRFILM